MTHVTSEDVFFGRKQEDFDLAEKLLIKYGGLSDKCVREMADIAYDRMGMVECHKILKRVWDDMRVKRLEDENTKLRNFAKLYLAAVSVDCGFCPYDEPWLCDTETDPMREGCRLWEELRELGVE